MDTASPVHDFFDLRMRADVLELCGDDDGARFLRDRSLEIAREVDLTCYAYQLLWRGQHHDAIAILEHTAALYPLSWNVHHSLGDVYREMGEADRAGASYRSAAALSRRG